MGMTALLTISTMFGTVTSQMPPVSYTTKLDIWMVGCIAFLFGALVEFTAVVFIKLYVYAPVPKPVGKKSQVTPPEKELATTKNHSNIQEKGKRLARRIDKASLVGFFAAFFAFNLVYWTDIIRVERQKT